MSKRWLEFYGPNGVKEIVDIKKLRDGDNESKRIVHKYAAVPYALALCNSRPYRGGISVTAALNGNRYNWLQYATDYAVDVDASAWLALGISTHALMENESDASLITMESEQFVEFEGIRGRYDLWYEIDDKRILVDYKVVGSYEIVHALGVQKKGEREKIGADGKPELYKRSGRGYSAGDIKKVPTYSYNVKRGENRKYRMQGTMYRIALEQDPNSPPIDEFRVKFIVRDGNTQMAKQRGVERRTYFIPFDFMDTDEVLNHYRTRRDELQSIMDVSEAITGGESVEDPQELILHMKDRKAIPPMCNEDENWNGRRCRDYCPVAAACKMIGDNPYLK